MLYYVTVSEGNSVKNNFLSLLTLGSRIMIIGETAGNQSDHVHNHNIKGDLTVTRVGT
jgi:hypothetical protein